MYYRNETEILLRIQKLSRNFIAKIRISLLVNMGLYEIFMKKIGQLLMQYIYVLQ